jgi:head-tail adaptor
MKKALHIVFAVMLLWPVCAGAQNSSLSQRSKSRIEAIRNSHNDKVEKLKAEHEAFRRDVMERWGEKEMVESTKKVWVEYSDDRNARFRVDFEKGVVVIEILSEKNESRQSIIGRIEKTVESLLDS